jgi:hypothetical protein
MFNLIQHKSVSKFAGVRSSGARTAVIGVVLALIAPLTASAEELQPRVDLNNRSLVKGLDRASVPLLKRLPGAGAQAVARALSAKFGAGSKLQLAGKGTESVNPGRVRIDGADGAWGIDVKGDGSAARVQRYDYLKTAPRVAPQQRIASAELEALGRQFIATDLRDFVRVTSDDELVALKTEYQVESAGQGPTLAREEVAAATVVFGRKRKGVDIVGAGSKIMVTFANDRQPVAFSFDWPEYVETGKVQRVQSIDLIRERVTALSSMRFQAASVTIRRFECGYFDAGARTRTRDLSASIQSACLVHYVGSSATGKPGSIGPDEGVMDPIPAGELVEADTAWPHAAAVRQYGDICRQSPVAGAFNADPGAAR